MLSKALLISINAVTYQHTQDFLNIMQSMGVHPLITKPTRITEFSATLIDNILTNNINIVNNWHFN